MKLILFILIILTLKSYAQDCTQQYSNSHVIHSNPTTKIEKCVKWQAPNPRTTPDGAHPPSTCVEFTSCNLQLPGFNELISVMCKCRIRHSTKHPEYDPQSAFPYWDSISSACNYDKAEEEAREGCTSKFNLSENENPKHWVTTIDCKRVYTYTCENDETLSRR